MDIDNFTYEEFSCKCGCGENTTANSTKVKLENMRIDAGIPFIISATRCPAYNRKVGGVKDSTHMTLFDESYGIDIDVENSRDKYILVTSAIRAGFTRIGIAETFIHVDDSPVKVQEVIWTY